MTPTPGQADDAMLRLIFNEVAADHEMWRKHPMIAWKRLYDLVTTTEAASVMLGHLACQDAEIDRLQHEVDRLNRLVSHGLWYVGNGEGI